MIEVKRPELLTSSLTVSKMLHPSKGSLKLQMSDVSEATLTLEDKAETIPMHGWVKIYNQFGFVGIFRRTSREQTVATDNNYTLRHGIDILQDSVWDDETEFSGTHAQFLTALLNKQTQLINGVKPWALGTCADTSTIKKDINYDNLLDLFKSAAEESGNYYYTYDQTTWPWTVNLVAKPSAVASEFRLDRNIDRCRINDNDSELCTRLLLNVNAMEEDEDLEDDTGISVDQNKSTVITYRNTAAEAIYGVITKTADIDIEGSLPEAPGDPCPEADAWAADFMARRSAPKLQIEIDGQVLKQITNSDWDESKIGTKVQVALPEYAQAIAERCVTVSYPELFRLPDKVTVSLANAYPTYSKATRNTESTISNLSKGYRSSSRKAESFDQHFKVTDDTGKVLKQAGMHLDADGLLVYADNMENMVGAKFNVHSDMINMVVGTYDQGGYFIKAGEIALSINDTTGESRATINANHVNISSTNTAHLLSGSIVYDSDGNLVLKETSGAGIIVEHNRPGEATATFGIWDKGDLTGGVMVQEINGQTTTRIKGKKINIGDVDGTSDVSINDAFDIETYSGVQSIKMKKQVTAYHNMYILGGNLTVSPLNSAGGSITGKEIHVGTDGKLVFDDRNNSTEITRANALGFMDTGGHVALTSSGNTYTLWYLPVKTQLTSSIATPSTANGWVNCGSFSRATSLSGAWSSGVFTVNASPQGESILTSLTVGTPTINQQTGQATLPIKATINSGATVYDTGKTAQVNITELSMWEGNTHYTGNVTISSAVTLQAWCKVNGLWVYNGESVTITPDGGGGTTYTSLGSGWECTKTNAGDEWAYSLSKNVAKNATQPNVSAGSTYTLYK